MKKIVFFYKNRTEITDGLRMYLHMAKHIADTYSEYEVYYVNYYNEAANKIIGKSKVIFRDYESVDFCNDFFGAVVVTQSNYIQLLVNNLNAETEAKIMVWDWNSHIFDYWVRQYSGKECRYGEFAKLLQDSNAWNHTDKNCYLGLKRQFNLNLIKSYIPYAVDEYEKTFFTIFPAEERISIGWVGNMTAESQNGFNNLVYNVQRLSENVAVDIHIIGDKPVSLAPNTEKVRYIVVPTSVCPEEYLAQHVNVVMGAGYLALQCASAGLPVIIPCFGVEPFYTDKYMWLYDADEYILSFSKSNMKEMKNKMHSLKEICNELKDEDKIKEIQKLCRAYVAENHSIERVGKVFLDNTKRSQLTIKECLNCELLKLQKDAYTDYIMQCEEGNYDSFVSKRQAADEWARRSKLGKLKHFVKNVLWGTYGRKGINFAKNIRKYKRYKAIQKGYNPKIAYVKKVLENNHKLKVAFIVLYEATFPGRPIFERMLKDELFDPYIIVTTDKSRGYDYMIQTYHKSCEFFNRKYPGRVIAGYNEEWDSYLELHDEYSIICFANIYSNMVHPYHEIQYFLNKNVLTLYVYYGFAAIKYGRVLMQTDFYNTVWKLFVDSEINRQDLKRHQPIRAINAVSTSYIKMDELALVEIVKRERKKIIICPHHTVSGWKLLDISNFLKYSELFQRLPVLYPEIDFVFRPHPLLFLNLEKEKIWSKEQTDSYLARLVANSNMVYDTSGDYFDTFMNSDAMIHDCSSFIGEYLFTEKPCCYMLKSKQQIKDVFIPMGEMCMEQYYKAFSEEDIIQFIDSVVIGGVDPLKESREKFSREVLKYNYPHSAEYVIDYIKREILN